MSQDIAIIGIGLHPFGRHEGVNAIQMGVKAANLALEDARVPWKDIQFAFAGALEVTQPDSIIKFLGLTGIPFTSIFNGCATGGSLLLNASHAIHAGSGDVGIVIGFDKHPRGAFSVGDDMEGIGLGQWYGATGMAMNPQFFAMKTKRYMYDHGITSDCLTRIAMKNFKNGSLNPAAWRRKALDYEAIENSPMVCDPLRQYHFCSPSEGAAAVVVCRADVARRYTTNPIYLRADVFTTRLYGSFETMSPSNPVRDVPSPTVQASQAAYEAAGIGPQDIDVAQLQDTEAGHEMMHMAENGFCKDGEQEALVREGETAIDGRIPINTDGGLMANGEPIGASGLRQIYEVCLQLRGDAGSHQIPRDVKTGYTHVYGFPGVSCVTILST
ncbi:MAG: thiolase family protein [Myxococcales bacterium]|nr:thiolase family protein [Gemmatimonadota bacterium]MCH8133731.1 thiolase family protein [Myxococcales bacterium]